VSYRFELPEEAVWPVVGWLLLMAVNTYRRWQKDRVANAVWKTELLTKTEHTLICTENQKALKEQQVTVIKMLEEQNTSSNTFRTDVVQKIDSVKSDVGMLKTDVAVLKATQPTTQVNVRGS
jgi:hypothetical protein